MQASNVDSGWLDHIQILEWDRRTDLIKWGSQRTTVAFPLSQAPLSTLEATHKHLRQALRVTFASRKSSEDRAHLLYSWRKSVTASFTAPIIFSYLHRFKYGTVIQGEWARDLTHISTILRPNGDRLIGLRWGSTTDLKAEIPLKTIEANFPGFSRANIMCEALGLDPKETANYLRDAILLPKKIAPHALPQLSI